MRLYKPWTVLALVVLFAISCREQGYSPEPLKMDQLASTVTLPAGSVDGLAAALAAAGPGGTVIVEAGMHTESAGVEISSSVSILGEPGAILRVDTAPVLAFPAMAAVALHIRNAPETRVQGLELLPVGAIGGVAIMIEDADGVLISNNTIRDHQFSVLIQNGDHTQIRGNTIETSLAWLSGSIPEAHGIININGEDTRLEENVVRNAVFGIFACDANGTARKNEVSNCLVGFNLCKVPPVLQLPSGEIVGSEVACTQWKFKDNLATNNFTVGYMVIDGANNNRLSNNAASGNGTYDIELVGDDVRFGMPVPTSFENTVKLGKHKDLVIKDCGLNNRVKPRLTDVITGPCGP